MVRKILLWTCWLLGMYVGFFALGTLLYAPAADLPARVVCEQFSASLGGPRGLAILGFGALALSITSRRWLRRLRQRESDALARHILAELRAGRDPTREFFVYLRASIGQPGILPGAFARSCTNRSQRRFDRGDRDTRGSKRPLPGLDPHR